MCPIRLSHTPTGTFARSSTRAFTRGAAGAAVALATAAAALTVTAAPARAQEGYGWGRHGGGRGGSGTSDDGYGRSRDGARPLFAWTGRVDREVLVVMRDGDVQTRYEGRDASGGGRARVASQLPRVPGDVEVRVLEGRGQADVVEQPTRANGYTTVVRIRDDRGGADQYRIVATWRGAGGYADDGRGDEGYGDPSGRWGRRGSGDGRWGRESEGRSGRDGDDRYGSGRYGNGGYGDGRYGDGGTGVLHWRGRVDDVEELRVHGTRVDLRTLSGSGASNVQSRVEGAGLPAGNVAVRVAERQGRGRVVVAQQPAAWNGYTAVIRVEDHDAGAGWYDFDVTW